MNRNTSKILLMVILLAGVLLAAVPVAAQASRTTFTATEFMCGAEPGNEWLTRDGTKQHIRGQIFHDAVVSDEPRMTGAALAFVNMNVDLLSGDCNAWGKEIYEVAGGSWMLNYSGRCVDFVYAGGGVGRGTGDLQGQVLFLQAQQLFPIPADNACPGGVAYGAYALSGVILEP